MSEGREERRLRGGKGHSRMSLEERWAITSRRHRLHQLLVYIGGVRADAAVVGVGDFFVFCWWCYSSRILVYSYFSDVKELHLRNNFILFYFIFAPHVDRSLKTMQSRFGDSLSTTWNWNRYRYLAKTKTFVLFFVSLLSFHLLPAD